MHWVQDMKRMSVNPEDTTSGKKAKAQYNKFNRGGTGWRSLRNVTDNVDQVF